MFRREEAMNQATLGVELLPGARDCGGACSDGFAD